jgi:SAM-dependent methyltransferase
VGVADGGRLAALYDWHNEHMLRDQADDLSYWLRRILPRRRVAVLGAGTGRVAAPLSTSGVNVIAVDSDLHRLRRIPGSTSLAVCGDFRALPLSGPFDHVLFPYNTIQLVEPANVAATLVEAARLLDRSSRLWLDLSDRFASRSDHGWSPVLEAESSELGLSVLELQRGVAHSDHYRIDVRYLVRGSWFAEMTERWYFQPEYELRSAISAASLVIQSLTHGYSPTGPRHRRIYELSLRAPTFDPLPHGSDS